MANNGTKDSDYVFGLDIGTSKVVCIIGKYVDEHSLEVVSMGSYPSSGLKKGVVVNLTQLQMQSKNLLIKLKHHMKEKLRMYMLDLNLQVLLPLKKLESG